MRLNAQARILFVAVVLALVFTRYSMRLVELHVDKHEEYSELAAQKNSIRKTIHALRGGIFDRNGEPLATSIPIRTAVADGSRIKDPARLAEVAAPYLDVDGPTLQQKLATDRRYVVIAKNVPEQNAAELRRVLQKEKLRGLDFEFETDRVYPNGPMLCHVLGFTNHEKKGVQGIERTMQPYLKGEDGYRYTEKDRTGREIVVYRGQEQPARNGLDVHLSIDMGLQAIVEEELDAAFEQLKPQTAVAVFVDPMTGEVLAMASRPHFDLGAIGEAKPEQMKNRAIIDMLEPGSTFKIVVMAAALNEGKANELTKVHCENGSFGYGGRILRDHHGYGSLTVHDILVKSSNIGSAKLALMLGGERYYEYVRRFGFGERTGVELPGEIPGLVHPPSRWDALTITRMPMGHSVAVTPLQMVMALSAIANGGKLMVPQMVKEIKDENGKVIASFPPTVVRQVVDPKTAQMVAAALREVVSERGTAQLAKVSGYSVAGKTGTAQRVDPKGGYTPGKYVVSFTGYLPADNPRLAGLVIVDDARVSSGLNYGGLIAAPIFSRIGTRAMRYLNIPPEDLQAEIGPVAMERQP